MGPKHILMIRFSSMGDVVLQTPLVSAIKLQYGENVRISFLTGSEFVHLLAGHSHIDRVLGFDRKEGLGHLIELVANLQSEYPIDFIIDLHSSLRSFILRTIFFRIPKISVDKRRWERFLFTKFKLNLYGDEPVSFPHRVINDFSFILPDILDSHQLSSYIHRNNPTALAQEGLTSLSEYTIVPAGFSWKKDYIVLAPSASFKNKRWPIDSFKQLARKLLQQGKKVVVLAGSEDDFCQNLNELSSEFKNTFLNLQGKTSLKETIGILKESYFVVGNDTGVLHIAEAYGVPVLAIFGPTSEYFGFVPHLKDSEAISVEMWCRPCSPTGKSGCIRSDLFCMKRLSVETVYAKSMSILETIGEAVP